MVTGIICHQFRQFATKSPKVLLTSADLLKSFNYENKALFGAVKKSKKKAGKAKISSSCNESEGSSEMYWLLEHKPSAPVDTGEQLKKKPGRPRKKSSLHITSPGNNSNDSKSDISSSFSGNSSSNPSQRTEAKEIPFSNKGIKSILNFPLTSTEVQDAPETIRDYDSLLPSVGKILQATLSDSARKSLIEWKLTKIRELGEDGFNQMQQRQLNEGKMFHKSLEDYFATGKEPQQDSDVYKTWESVSPVLRDLSPAIEFTEKMVEHPFLKYRGVVDCVCKVNSEMAVIEWKKSDKQKTTINATFDAPLQLCAYLGALSADPQYKLHAAEGYVIVANTMGQPAQVHRLDEITLRRYWQLWLRRLQEFWIRTRDGTLPEPI